MTLVAIHEIKIILVSGMPSDGATATAKHVGIARIYNVCQGMLFEFHHGDEMCR